MYAFSLAEKLFYGLGDLQQSISKAISLVSSLSYFNMNRSELLFYAKLIYYSHNIPVHDKLVALLLLHNTSEKFSYTNTTSLLEYYVLLTLQKYVNLLRDQDLAEELRNLCILRLAQYNQIFGYFTNEKVSATNDYITDATQGNLVINELDFLYEVLEKRRDTFKDLSCARHWYIYSNLLRHYLWKISHSSTEEEIGTLRIGIKNYGKLSQDRLALLAAAGVKEAESELANQYQSTQSYLSYVSILYSLHTSDMKSIKHVLNLFETEFFKLKEENIKEYYNKKYEFLSLFIHERYRNYGSFPQLYSNLRLLFEATILELSGFSTKHYGDSTITFFRPTPISAFLLRTLIFFCIFVLDTYQILIANLSMKFFITLFALLTIITLDYYINLNVKKT